MRTKLHTILRKALASFTIGVMLGVLVVPNIARAAYFASDVLGQNSFTAGTPNAETLTVPNRFGMNGPVATALDSTNHRLFVADSNNNRVMVYELDSSDEPLDHEADFVLGQPDLTSNGAATTAGGMTAPYGLVYDAVVNRLFVADQSNNRVLVFDVAAITNGEDAVSVLGQVDFTSGDSATSQSGLDTPSGLAFDAVGNRLFVADTGNNRVMVFTVAVIVDGETAVSVLGQSNFTNGGSATSSTGMSGPTGVAFDSADNRLAVGDTDNNRVLVFDALIITDGEAAANVLGQDDFSSSDTGISYDWATVFEDEQSDAMSFALDAANGVLYAGTATNGNVMRCVTMSGCDELDDWTTSLDSNEWHVSALLWDSANGTLYAATRDNGLIYRCATATGCDEDGDWTISLDSASQWITAMAIDAVNGVIYATGVGFGRIQRCETSTGCDASGDWTVTNSFDNAYSITIDTANSVIYAGFESSGGRILRCDIVASGGCNGSGWTTAFTLGSVRIGALTVDSANGILYAGDQAGKIYRCDTVSLCDANGDFTTAFDEPSFFPISALVFDAGGILYVGTSGFGVTLIGSGIIYRCDTATLCNANSDFTTSYDTPETTVHALFFDSVDGTLYAGTGTSGTIYRCDTATVGSCDDSGDWTEGAESSEFNRSLLFDSVNDILYAGSETNGIIRRCDKSTGCDDVGDWTVSFNTEQVSIRALILDATNGIIYAGTSSGGIIYRCDTATGCDAGSDWTTTFDTTETSVNAFIIDPVTGFLYAGTSSDGLIYRCDTAVGGSCDDSGDWSLVFDLDGGGSEPDVLSFAIVEFAGSRFIYFTTGGVVGNGEVFRCNTVLGCDATGDWLTALATADSMITSIVFDPDADVIYAGSFTSGIIRRCAMTTNCDASGDWTTSFDTTDRAIEAIMYDPVGQALLAGTSPGGIIYRCETSTLCNSSGDWTTIFDSGETGIAAVGIFSFAVDADNVIYAGSGENIVYQCDPGVGCGVLGLSGPRGVAFDAAGDRLFVADSGDNRALVYDVAVIADGEQPANVLGQDDFVSSSAGISQDTLQFPVGAEYDAVNDRLLIADTGNHRIMVFDTAAISDGDNAVDVVGQVDANGDPVFDAGSADNQANPFVVVVSSQGMSSPVGSVVDTVNHRLFVGDNGNNRVLVFELDTDNLLVDHTADFVLGQSDFSSNAASVSQSGMSGGLTLAYDPDNDRLFVAEETANRVLVFDTASITNGEDAIAVLGQDDFDSAVAAVSQDGFSQALSVAYDRSGERLFVVDAFRVLVFNVALITNGEPAVNVLGQEDFTSSVAATTQDGMNAPSAAAFDDDNERLFVSEQGNNRVLIFELVGGISNGMNASGVLGQEVFTSGGANITQDGMSAPYGLDYDAELDQLFVSDQGANRVLVFDVATISDGEDALAVIGQDDFTSGGAGLDQDRFDGPYQSTLDEENRRLYVPDFNNNRVLIFDLIRITTETMSTGVVDADYYESINYNISQGTVTFSLVSGSLPPGLSLDGSTGEISGTPTAVGTYAFTIRAEDDNGGAGIFADQQDLSVTILSAGGYLASDLVGQLDEFDQPFFTSSGTDNRPNARGFGAPKKMAIDTVGHRLFVADSNNSRVMVFNLDSSNQVTDRIADYVLGQPNFKTNSGGTTASLMSQPEGLAYDEGMSRLFVSDAANNRVLVFDLSGGITTGMAASNVIGQATFDDDGSATSATGMMVPNGLLYDSTGNRLFVADTFNHRILVFDLAGGITNGMAASFELGQTDGNANLDFFDDAVPAISATGMIDPIAIGYDSANQRLFVADSQNDRILVFDVTTITNGEPAVNVLGQPNFTSGDPNWPSLVFAPTATGMFRPVGVAYDPTGQRLFVADYQNNRVMVFDVLLITNGEPAVNVLGQPDFTSNGSPTSATSLWAPQDVLVDSAGQRLFVTEQGNNRVMVFDVTTIINGEPAVDLLGQLDENDEPVYTTSGGDNAPNPQGVNAPNDAALDVIGHRLFVADTTNHRILVFNLDTDNVLVDHTADLVLGQSDFKGNGPGLDQDLFNGPTGLVYDEVGQRLFVADLGNNRVMVFDAASITNGEDATGVLGQDDFTSNGSATAQDGFSSPQRLAYDPAIAQLFVSDTGNNRVMVFDAALITNGEDAINVLGQEDFTSNGSATTQDGFLFPIGLTLDNGNNRLFVVDTFNYRVLVFDVASITNGEDAINVLGQEDFTSSGPATTQDGLDIPIDATYDSGNDRLFVTETGNHRILVFDVTTITDGENAMAVLGQLDFTSADSGTTQYSLQSPYGLIYDSELARLYEADIDNHRVLIYDFVRITTTPLSDGTEGEAYSESINTVQSQGIVSFSLVSGALPPGLSLNSSTGDLSGTPTTPGTYTFTVRATDDNGSWGEYFDDQEYTMTVQESEDGAGGGGGFIPGSTPTPTPGATPLPPGATPAPLAGYIIIDDQAPVTKDRFVKLSFKHPFADDQGVTMRPVNGGQLASNDRDVVAANTARQQETGANPTPTVAPNTPEMSSGQVRPFTPEVFGWDLCAGAKECPPGRYNVFVQYYKAGSAPSSLTVLAGMAGDQTSYIYTDDVAYVPPATMPFPPPAPVAPGPGPGPSGPSGPVATPTPAPVPSPTPSVSATPATSPAGTPATGPQPSGAPSTPIFSLESLGLSPETIEAIGEAVSVAAPIVVVLTVAPIALALATALAAGNAVAFTMFTTQSLLTVFGLKRRPRVWGTVYDAKTKHPIAYAKVELRDQSNRVLETRYTDTEGRYGFLITPASLQQESLQLVITPSAKSYAFPSALVTTDPDYIVYDHIYRGGQIAIRRDELVNYNIPMDPGTTPAKVGRPWSYGSNIVEGILNAGFWIGLVVLPINAFLFPSLFTIGMLTLFLVANAIRLGVGFHRPYGIVQDDRVRTAVPYSLVTLNDPTGKRIAFTVSDDRGRYIMLAKPGSYLVTVHTPAQVQPQRQKTTAVTTKKGWVTGTVNV